MGETEVHIQCLVDVREALRSHFRDAADVYVGADLMLYYEEGNPRRSVSPDVFVTRGVPKLPQRRTYLVWREGRPPDFVLEITSPSTRREDLQSKRATYERMGVAEYALFDPLDEYLRPALQGFRLVEGRYEPWEATPEGHLVSDVLGLELRHTPGGLRLFDPASGRLLLTPDEREDALAAEARARRSAETELEQLRAELERLRRGGAGAGAGS
jgi:Uma2 family endonuclease